MAGVTTLPAHLQVLKLPRLTTQRGRPCGRPCWRFRLCLAQGDYGHQSTSRQEPPRPHYRHASRLLEFDETREEERGVRHTTLVDAGAGWLASRLLTTSASARCTSGTRFAAASRCLPLLAGEKQPRKTAREAGKAGRAASVAGAVGGCCSAPRCMVRGL
ncbi:hypothetical protein NDU88_002715 [Pleurodeles waltl]|uniref:Uncharacterized protein n=1 Tax=Pleurodeles waltl TaxID=8319 RepID=A0AAV7UWF2_PLEWA|nr:hypothetical protein NDU88_002715 [Pleurodeles waltl]